jgi:hypothetical protein
MANPIKIRRRSAVQVSLPHFPLDGGCVCSAVRYHVLAPPLAVYACHCKDCQRFSGAPYSMAMAVRKEEVELTLGEVKAFAKPADSGRVVGVRFCRDCGTRLWHVPAHSPHLLTVTVGTLDDMSWAEPVAHVWTKSKMPWVTIAPGLLAFDGQPEAREPIYEAWARATG